MSAVCCVLLAAAGYLSSYEDISVTSRPVEALAADGSAVTLRQALLPLLAECVTGSRGADSTPASLTVPATLLAASSGSTALVGNDRGSLEAATASSDAKPAAEPEVGAALVEAGSGAAESGDASSPARDSTSNAAGHDETGVGGATESTCLLEASVAQRRLLVAGTTPPLDAPLAWLHAQLHAPDFFLYIVLHAGR
jgi:autophagy-related protein 5